MPELDIKTTKCFCITLQNGAFIFYNPTDKNIIPVLIAHQLGHLLQAYGITIVENAQTFANLFAFIAINGESSLYAPDNSPNFYRTKEEIIEGIKKIGV
jgi:hypothetical protein